MGKLKDGSSPEEPSLLIGYLFVADHMGSAPLLLALN